MEEHHQNITGPTPKYGDQDDSNKDIDGAVACSSDKEIHETPPTLVLLPSPSDGSTEDQKHLIDRELSQSDSENVGEDDPTEIVSLDTHPSSTTPSKYGDQDDSDEDNDGAVAYSSDNEIHETPPTLVLLPSPSDGLTEDQKHFIEREPCQSDSENVGEDDPTETVSLDTHPSSTTPIKHEDQGDRGKDIDGAVACSSDKEIHETPPNLVLLPSPSGGSTEDQKHFIERKPSQSDSENVGEDDPTETVSLDTHPSSTTPTKYEDQDDSNKEIDGAVACSSDKDIHETPPNLVLLPSPSGGSTEDQKHFIERKPSQSDSENVGEDDPTEIVSLGAHPSSTTPPKYEDRDDSDKDIDGAVACTSDKEIPGTPPNLVLLPSPSGGSTEDQKHFIERKPCQSDSENVGEDDPTEIVSLGAHPSSTTPPKYEDRDDSDKDIDGAVACTSDKEIPGTPPNLVLLPSPSGGSTEDQKHFIEREPCQSDSENVGEDDPTEIVSLDTHPSSTTPPKYEDRDDSDKDINGAVACSSDKDIHETPPNLVLSPSPSNGSTEDQKHFIEREPCQSDSEDVGEDDPTEIVSLDTYPSSTTPPQCGDRGDRDKDIDGAVACSSDDEIHETLPTLVLLPSPSDGATEDQKHLIEREPSQSDNENVGEDDPTEIVSLDAHPSSTTPTVFNCVHGCNLSQIFSDIILPIFSIVTYVVDIGTDLWLVAKYAQAGHWWWLGWTLAFIVLTAFMFTAFFFCLFDEHENNILSTHPVLRVFVCIIVGCSLTYPVMGWVYH